MTWGVWWTSPDHSKILKFAFWDIFLSKLFNVQLKITEELCVMTLKGDAIFKERLTVGLKNDIRNLVNFHRSSRKSEYLHFDGPLLPIANNVSAKKVQKSYISWYWRAIQTLMKNWIFVWKNDMRNLVHFNASSGNSGNSHFDGLRLMKLFIV